MEGVICQGAQRKKGRKMVQQAGEVFRGAVRRSAGQGCHEVLAPSVAVGRAVPHGPRQVDQGSGELGEVSDR